MSDDSGRLQELEIKKRKKIKLSHAEERELKKLQKAVKCHCMCMGGTKPEVFGIGKKR